MANNIKKSDYEEDREIPLTEPKPLPPEVKEACHELMKFVGCSAILQDDSFIQKGISKLAQHRCGTEEETLESAIKGSVEFLKIADEVACNGLKDIMNPSAGQSSKSQELTPQEQNKLDSLMGTDSVRDEEMAKRYAEIATSSMELKKDLKRANEELQKQKWSDARKRDLRENVHFKNNPRLSNWYRKVKVVPTGYKFHEHMKNFEEKEAEEYVIMVKYLWSFRWSKLYFSVQGSLTEEQAVEQARYYFTNKGEI